MKYEYSIIRIFKRLKLYTNCWMWVKIFYFFSVKYVLLVYNIALTWGKEKLFYFMIRKEKLTLVYISTCYLPLRDKNLFLKMLL